MAGILNNNEMRAISRNIRAIFYDQLKASPALPFLDAVFFVIQSNSLIEKFVMLRGTPKMRPWVGDRRINGLSQASFQIEKKDWEATISVTRDDLQFDRLGMVRPQIQELARAYPRHFVDFFLDLMQNGKSRLCYDGQYFFDTDHDKGDGTSYANKYTYPLDYNSVYLLLKTPRGLRDPESGELLDVAFDSIVFGTELRSRVDLIFNTPTVVYTAAGGTTVNAPNPLYGRIPKEKQHELRHLGTSTEWMLFDSSKALKPFMLQIVKGPSLESYDDPHDWNMFNRKEPVYGIDSQDNAGYMFWELAAYSDSSGAAAADQSLFKLI